MKKISFLLIFLLMGLVVACEAQGGIDKSKEISISIATDVNTYGLYMSSVKGITLTPKLEGKIDKDIQYHWSIDSNTEMFDSTDGPKNDIINSGESVLFVPVAEIDYAESDKLSNTIKVKLQIEEKESSTILAETELIIEDYSGTYKVKK